MIVETLVDFFLGFLRSLFSIFDLVTIPVDLILVLADFVAYGNWIVGIDVLGVFFATVVFWWSFHLSIGLIIWVWERLPLT